MCIGNWQGRVRTVEVLLWKVGWPLEVETVGTVLALPHVHKTVDLLS